MGKRFKVSVVVFFCLLAIALGKFVRFVWMYDSLVKQGIGWSMVEEINEGRVRYGWTIQTEGEKRRDSNATQNASYLFSRLNFLHLVRSYYGYEILITILCNFMLLSLLLQPRERYYRLSEIFLLVLSFAVLNIFDLCLAKEPIQLLYFTLMGSILRTRAKAKIKYWCCFLVYIWCFLTYRNYYSLMAGVFLCLGGGLWVYKKRIREIKIITVVLGLLLVVGFYIAVLQGARWLAPISFRELLRVRLRTSTAASDMQSVFRSERSAVLAVDYLVMMVRMLFPLELLQMGGKYAIYTLYQLLVTGWLAEEMRRMRHLSETRQIALLIYGAFLMGSAMFEPDFGSWVRHEAVLFPVLLVICGIVGEGE